MRRPHPAFTLAALLAACGGSTPNVAPPAPSAATTAAITPQDLRTRISIFADDSMQGRRTGTPSNAKGNGYIVAELRRLGLTPAGDSGSFLQRVPLMRFRLDSSAATLRAGSASIALWEYYPYQPDFHVPVRPVSGAPVVYIGGVEDASALPPRRVRIHVISGKNIASSATARMMALIGRVTNISRFPSDICNDWRKALSSIGPSTSASTSGAGG